MFEAYVQYVIEVRAHLYRREVVTSFYLEYLDVDCLLTEVFDMSLYCRSSDILYLGVLGLYRTTSILPK